jgi:hypothetical protein
MISTFFSWPPPQKMQKFNMLPMFLPFREQKKVRSPGYPRVVKTIQIGVCKIRCLDTVANFFLLEAALKLI